MLCAVFLLYVTTAPKFVRSRRCCCCMRQDNPFTFVPVSASIRLMSLVSASASASVPVPKSTNNCGSIHNCSPGRGRRATVCCKRNNNWRQRCANNNLLQRRRTGDCMYSCFCWNNVRFSSLVTSAEVSARTNEVANDPMRRCSLAHNRLTTHSQVTIILAARAIVVHVYDRGPSD